MTNTFILRMSDMALFFIHVTKIAIQNRLTRLEHNANVAGRDAIQSRKNGMSQSALTHMRRRKLALEEVERCTVVLANLDATELRLERAKDDVHIVQSYTLVKETLRNIRKSN